MIHVVGLGSTECIKAAKFIQGLQMLGYLGGNSVLSQLLADGSIEPFGRGTIIAPNVEYECVVELALLLNFIDDTARIVVSMLSETCENFHQTTLKRLFIFWDRIPRCHRFRTWR